MTVLYRRDIKLKRKTGSNDIYSNDKSAVSAKRVGDAGREHFGMFQDRNKRKFFAMNRVESAYDKHFLKKCLDTKFLIPLIQVEKI